MSAKETTTDTIAHEVLATAKEDHESVIDLTRDLVRIPNRARSIDYIGLHATDERIRLDTIPTIQAPYHAAALTLLNGQK
jgi:hypothetical protein